MELLAESAEDTLVATENRVRLVFFSIQFEKLQNLLYSFCFVIKNLFPKIDFAMPHV